MEHNQHEVKAKHEEHKHHVTPIEVYLKTFGMLIILTIVTVVTSYFDFGTLNLAIALLIASVKAILVMLFFMQLKYDDVGNQITFVSSFIFLAIFLGFTAADIFVRQEVHPMRIEKVNGGGGGETDVTKLNKVNSALLEKGKNLFTQQCVSCHGANGAGDGVAAAALNPKPRNFKSGFWRYGGSPSMIFKTLTQGSPGTAMAAFTTLSVEERYSLAHYVRSIASPLPPEDKPEETTVAVGLAAAAGGSAQIEIPVDYAIERMQENDQVVLPSDVKNSTHPGTYLFQAQCAQCHGTAGQGAQVSAFGANPPVYLITKSFVGMNAPWLQSEGEFIKVVSQGMPGRGMPGMAGYSSQEWSALYSYVKSLNH